MGWIVDDEKWTLVWASWGTAFAVAETIAVRSRNPEAPLSHTLRRVLGVRRKPMHHRAGQVAFVGFGWWLGWHLYRGVKSDG